MRRLLCSSTAEINVEQNTSGSRTSSTFRYTGRYPDRGRFSRWFITPVFPKRLGATRRTLLPASCSQMNLMVCSRPISSSGSGTPPARILVVATDPPWFYRNNKSVAS